MNSSRKSTTRASTVVFLLDEFERVTENVNFGPDFYYGLRSLMIHHKVALVTSSRLELIELCHSEAVKSSPFLQYLREHQSTACSPLPTASS